MNCPYCSTETTQIAFQDLLINQCGTCKGFFLNREQRKSKHLDAFCDGAGPQAMQNMSSRNQRVACPGCRTDMAKKKPFWYSDLTIDECPACNGMWYRESDYTNIKRLEESPFAVLAGDSPKTQRAKEFLAPVFEFSKPFFLIGVILAVSAAAWQWFGLNVTALDLFRSLRAFLFQRLSEADLRGIAIFLGLVSTGFLLGAIVSVNPETSCPSGRCGPAVYAGAIASVGSKFYFIGAALSACAALLLVAVMYLPIDKAELENPVFDETMLADWDKGLFSTPEEAAMHEWEQHARNLGKTPSQFTNDAKRFYDRYRDQAVPIETIDGQTAYEILGSSEEPAALPKLRLRPAVSERFSTGPGGYFTEDGKIISFWYSSSKDR